MEKNPKKYCEDMLPLVSRTFALGISLLQEPLAIQMGVSYLICRICDTLEDTNTVASEIRSGLLKQASTSLLFPTKRGNLLEEIKKTFPLEQFSGAEYDLLHNIDQVMDVFDSFPDKAREHIQDCVHKMAQGMALTVEREKNNQLHGLEDYKDFAQYCYYVAGTVGELSTKLFCHDRKDISQEIQKELEQREVDFGLGLQMTNILKGIVDDHKRGIVFLPHNLLVQHGLTIESLFHDPEQEACQKMVFSFIEYILPYMDKAVDYTVSIPESHTDIRLFCALPVLFAFRTLRLAKEYPLPLLKGEPLKIKRKEVKDLHLLAEKKCGDNHDLRKLFEKERDF
ncbi:MAG: squalene/phytoene synthase family protein [Candidatus Brocadiae bacterium]|nr:squalene/phytoene synthase family protein [Candidatus Brocadiia bacterium]